MQVQMSRSAFFPLSWWALRITPCLVLCASFLHQIWKENDKLPEPKKHSGLLYATTIFVLIHQLFGQVMCSNGSQLFFYVAFSLMTACVTLVPKFGMELFFPVMMAPTVFRLGHYVLQKASDLIPDFKVKHKKELLDGLQTYAGCFMLLTICEMGWNFKTGVAMKEVATELARRFYLLGGAAVLKFLFAVAVAGMDTKEGNVILGVLYTAITGIYSYYCFKFGTISGSTYEVISWVYMVTPMFLMWMYIHNNVDTIYHMDEEEKPQNGSMDIETNNQFQATNHIQQVQPKGAAYPPAYNNTYGAAAYNNTYAVPQ